MQTMVIFTDKGFIDDCTSSNQMITFCGVGSHHQNGIAERKIKDITLGGRTLLLHAKRMFPESIEEKINVCLSGVCLSGVCPCVRRSYVESVKNRKILP